MVATLKYSSFIVNIVAISLLAKMTDVVSNKSGYENVVSTGLIDYSVYQYKYGNAVDALGQVIHSQSYITHTEIPRDQ